MQVQAQDNYSDQIQRKQQEYNTELQKLKHQDKLDPKAKKRLHKKICRLYEELKDLKYKAASQYPLYPVS